MQGNPLTVISDSHVISEHTDLGVLTKQNLQFQWQQFRGLLEASGWPPRESRIAGVDEPLVTLQQGSCVPNFLLHLEVFLSKAALTGE